MSRRTGKEARGRSESPPCRVKSTKDEKDLRIIREFMGYSATSDDPVQRQSERIMKQDMDGPPTTVINPDFTGIPLANQRERRKAINEYRRGHRHHPIWADNEEPRDFGPVYPQAGIHPHNQANVQEHLTRARLRDARKEADE